MTSIAQLLEFPDSSPASPRPPATLCLSKDFLKSENIVKVKYPYLWLVISSGSLMIWFKIAHPSFVHHSGNTRATIPTIDIHLLNLKNF